MNNIELLDCTLRDGAYINGSNFGQQALKGIINKLELANIDIIECGWLKNDPYKEGSSYYHIPDDLKRYLPQKKDGVIYVAMIDWDRYDVDNLPVCDGKSLDAIRVVFPHGRHVEGIKVGEKIREKGYKVFFQLANTLAYSEQDLIEVAKQMNEFGPESISVVDTFGAMYEDDLDRILDTLVDSLDERIKIGFHAHNNMQLAFSLAIHFAKYMSKKNRKCIIDSTLSGMGLAYSAVGEADQIVSMQMPLSGSQLTSEGIVNISIKQKGYADICFNIFYNLSYIFYFTYYSLIFKVIMNMSYIRRQLNF